MADKEYVISYDTSSALKGAKNVDAFTASIVKHDAATASDLAAVKKQAAAYNELATAAGKATKMVDGLAASMAAATAQTNSFATATTGAGVAALDVEKAGKAASATVRAFGKNMDGAATSSKAAAHGIDQAAAATRSANIPMGSMGAAVKSAASGYRAFSKAAATAATNTTAVANAATAATPALNGAATAAGAAKTGFQGIKASAGGAAKGTDALANGLQRLVSTAAALGILRKVVGEIGDAIKESRDFDTSTADSNFEKREQARELAFNMKEKGVTDKVMGRIFGTGIASGMTFQESLKHNQELEGSIVAGVLKGNIREDQKEAVARSTAIVARRAGLDAKTAGDMTGTITQFENFNTDKNGKAISAERAGELIAAKLDSMVTALAGGRGSVSTLARGEISQAMSAVGSGRATLDEMSGLISTASNYAKTASGTGTKYSQLSALINKPDDSVKEFMEKSGAGAAKGDVAKLQAIKKYTDASKPADVDLNTWLHKQGFTAKGERESIVSMLPFVGSKEAPNVLEKNIAAAQANALDTSGTQARNAAFLAMPDSQMARAKAARDAAEYGHGHKTEAAQVAREAAAARLIARGVFKDKTQLVADAVKGGFGIKEWAGLSSQIQQRIEEEALRSTIADAGNKGVPIVPNHQSQINFGAAGVGKKEGSYKPADLTKTQPHLLESAISVIREDPEEAARLYREAADKGVNVVGDLNGIAAQQKAADRDPAKAAAFEAAKKPKPGAPVTQPVDLKATPRPNGSPVLPPTPDGKRFGVVDAGGAQPGTTVADAGNAKLDRAGDKLNQAADKLLTAMQQANMPGLPSNFGQNIGGYRA